MYRTALKSLPKSLCWSLIALLFLGAAKVYLESVPPIGWDEGWTLSVARNWVELGHYGRLSLGDKVPSGLQAALPVTGAVALAFKYAGVGLVQARLVIVGYLIASLICLFVLACRFFGRRIAVAALVVLLLSGGMEIHPLLLARQVLGEVPALFFLLAGYLCFFQAGEKPRIYLLCAISFWSIAIITKAQVLPFWFASLTVPLAAALFLRRWSIVRLFGAAILGSGLLGYFWQHLITQFLIPNSFTIQGLQVTAGLVFNPFRRVIALATTFEVGLPTLLGLVWTVRKVIRKESFDSHAAAVRLSYYILATTWFVWFELASVGWPRYLFPSAFLASIFVAQMFHDWTDGFRFMATLRRVGAVVRRLQFSQRDLYAVAALILVVWATVQTTKDLVDAFSVGDRNPLLETVDYLHNQTPTTAVIETYDSELFFYLRRRYHYPPDQFHVELIQRKDHARAIKMIYDPLGADPDYLVVGNWCRYYKCFDSGIIESAFKLVKTFGPYQVFERRRSLSLP